MSATTQPTTFSDLYTDLQNRIRATTGVTATENIAKRYINTALHDMHMGFEYRLPWAERRAEILARATYTTGTVSISRGSINLTGSGTAWTSSDDFSVANIRANGKVLIGGSRMPYTVSGATTATAITLANAFAEESVSGVSYIYYEDEYALATDFLRPVDMQVFSAEASIDLISRTEFRRRYPSNSQPGTPSAATIIDASPVLNSTLVRRVKLGAPPSTYLRIPYSYITSYLAVDASGGVSTNLASDSSEPLMPLRYRHVIVLHALYNWYRDLKDDGRSGEVKAEYTDAMLRIALDNDIGSPRPMLAPRIGHYARRARSPYTRGWR